MIDNKKVSVIIPYYNTEKVYFDACLKSVKDSLYKNIEIIIIDDGSEREYAEYLNQLNAKNPKLKIFRQKNSGPSAARNLGLTKISGEFILFVDSDDTVSDDYILELVKCANDFNSDITYSSMCLLTNDGQIASRAMVENTRNLHYFSIDLEEYGYSNFIANMWNVDRNGLPYNSNEIWISTNICGKLFKSEILERVRFDEKLVNGEDQMLSYDSTLISKKIAFTNRGTYHYRQNAESIQHMVDSTTVDNYIKLLNTIRIKTANNELLGLNKCASELRSLFYIMADNLNVMEFVMLSKYVFKKETVKELCKEIKLRHAQSATSKLINSFIKRRLVLAIYYTRKLGKIILGVKNYN